MISPCGHRLVVKPHTQEQVDEVLKRARAAGLTIVNSNQEREDASVDRGVVLSIGPTAWKTESLGNSPWCKVGDEVLFAKFAGKIVEDPTTKEKVFILNDEDVVAVLTAKE